MIDRRMFLYRLTLGAVVVPRGAVAQQAERVRRIGILLSVSEHDPQQSKYLAAFAQVLQDSGWTTYRNIRIEYRWASAKATRARTLAAELVNMNPDVILAQASLALTALQQATHSIPIVFVDVSDPVAGGFVPNLAHPGGNVTGFMLFEFTMGGKWLGMLKEIAPGVSRVLITLNPDSPSSARHLRSIEDTAPSFRVQLSTADVRDHSLLDRAISAVAREPNAGLIVLPDVVQVDRPERIIGLAALHRLPAVYTYRYLAAAGGLVSYGVDQLDHWRGAAKYVDRILRGEKPADLPVPAPTKFELVINKKTAQALGITIPPSLLLRADTVIE